MTTTAMMKTAEEMRAEVTARAGNDPEFRARLLEDPRGAIQEAIGVTIPGGFAVNVHEESVTTFHIVLPPSDQLTEADLHAVVGGHHKNCAYD